MQLRHILFPLMMIISCISLCIDNFDITLKSEWQELGCDNGKCPDFGGKWVLVGSIIFKRRSKNPIFVNEINMRWHGQNLDNLVASLYRKTYGKEFLAIEENLICDGTWNATTQTLILDFKEKEKLGPTTVFYLVLTVPAATEPILKNGYFSLENNCLPQQFKQCAQNERLILAINDSMPKQASH